MRLFTAITFPPEIRAVLGDYCGRLRGRGLSGGFTRPENLHLTLVFIGESDEVEAARQALPETAGTPFSIHLERIGSFRRQGGDLLWMGVRHSPPLQALRQGLCQRLCAAGFAVDARPYRPHVTLGRRMHLPEHPALETLSALLPAVEAPVAALSLMRSERVDGRLAYRELARAPLGG